MSTAAVRMVCGACGAVVKRGDAVCPSCGAALQFGEDSSGPPCPACGHRNDPGRELCESCGARLGSGPTPRKDVRVQEKARKRKSSQPEGRRRAEPWMYIAGASILALIVYVVSLALQSPSSSPVPGGGVTVAPPAGPVAPAGGAERIAALEQAVRDRPDDGEALLALANALHDQRAWDRAIEAYQKYLQKNPGNPDARVDLGICYFELSQLKPEKAQEYFLKAVSEMESALKRSPRHVPAAFNLGVIHLQHGEIQKSNEWFRRAVAMDKNHPLAQHAQRMLEQHSFTN